MTIMNKAKYNTIQELVAAIKSRKHVKKNIIGYDDGGELFVREAVPDGYVELFTRYYGTHNACCDICSLLGITREVV